MQEICTLQENINRVKNATAVWPAHTALYQVVYRPPAAPPVSQDRYLIKEVLAVQNVPLVSMLKKPKNRRCTDCPVRMNLDPVNARIVLEMRRLGVLDSPLRQRLLFLCEDKFSLKKCQRYKRKNRCTSEEKAKDSGLSWVDYLEDICRQICQLCNPNWWCWVFLNWKVLSAIFNVTYFLRNDW